MRQVFSDRQTIFIQAGVGVVVLALLLWGSYATNTAPGWAYSPAGGVAWFFIMSFVASSVVGALMHGLNLVFYRIQVYRHGYPHEQLEGSE